MNKLDDINMTQDETISYAVGKLSAELATACGILVIFFFMLSCLFCRGKKAKTDSNIYKFSLHTHRALNSFDKGVDYDDDLTMVESKLKNVYIYYKFDTLSPSIKESYVDEANDPYVNMEKFIGIINTFDDPTQKIILHISSPGGFAYKFEKIYDKLVELRSKGYEIIALVDDYCASGGYMVACGCNKIICSENAKIGSIGVISSCFNAYELASKYGIVQETFKSNENKGGIPLLGKYTELDRDRVQNDLMYTFNNFKKIVARERPDANIDEVATAKVWYGADALNIKLVDLINGPDEYMKTLKSNGNIYIASFKNNKKKDSFLKRMLLSYVSTTQIKKFIFELFNEYCATNRLNNMNHMTLAEVI